MATEGQGLIHTGQLHYTNADVGLRTDRPFRVILTDWAHTGVALVPGDDPDAPVESSRALKQYYGERAEHALVRLHTHEFFEFVVIRQSAGNLHLLEGGAQPLTRGDVIIVAPGAAHGFQPMYGLHKADMVLQPQWLSYELRLLWGEGGLVAELLANALFGVPVERGLWRVHLDEAELAACEHEVDTLTVEATRARPSLALNCGCFLKTVALLNRAYCRQNDRPYGTLSPLVWKTTEAVERLVEAGLPFDLSELAYGLGTSRRSLERAFSAATGMAVRTYYQRRRIQHAERMLTEPHTNVTEVAHRLGFADTSHFIRAFRKVKGSPPARYRRGSMTAEGGVPQAPGGATALAPPA